MGWDGSSTGHVGRQACRTIPTDRKIRLVCHVFHSSDNPFDARYKTKILVCVRSYRPFLTHGVGKGIELS